MSGNCVLAPATYYKMKEMYSDSPCNHCMYKAFGCPNKQAILVNGYKYIPIEENESKLPKCGIWCKNCKDNTGKIQHEVLWNGHRAYAIKCPICQSEFILYKHKVQYQYTGYVNMKGEFVKPVPYGTKDPREGIFTIQIPSGESEQVYSSEYIQQTNTAMSDALKKAGLI